MHSKIKKSISFITLTLCVNMQLLAMDPLTFDNYIEVAFEEYMQNGNPRGDEDMPILKYSPRAGLTCGGYYDVRTLLLTRLERDNGVTGFTKNLSSPAYAQQLPNLPSNEIANRFTSYRNCIHDFIDSVIAKQIILKSLKQENDIVKRNKFLKYLELVDKYMITLSTWLTTIRDSGEEHYIGKCSLKPDMPNDDPEFRNSTLFWKNTLRPNLLLYLRADFSCNTRHSFIYNRYLPEPTFSLNATSMAILRNQLDKGFPNLTYKKDTAYTGPALCVIKMAGQEYRTIDFAVLLEALDLAEQNQQKKELRLKEIDTLDLDTQSLWQEA